MRVVKSLDSKPHSCRIDYGSTCLQSRPQKVSREPEESKGAREPLHSWQCLNRLRTGVGRCRHLMQRWVHSQYANFECDCGEDPQTVEHLLECLLLPEPAVQTTVPCTTPVPEPGCCSGEDTCSDTRRGLHRIAIVITC